MPVSELIRLRREDLSAARLERLKKFSFLLSVLILFIL